MSVVRTKQPTLASFRTTQGRRPRRGTGDDRGRRQHERSSARAETRRRPRGRAAAGEARVAEDREPGRRPESERQQRALPLRDDEREQHHAATSSWSRTSRFRCTSCQTRYGCSVAIIAPTTPTARRHDAPSDLETSSAVQRRPRSARCRRPPVPLEDRRDRRGTRRRAAACSRTGAGDEAERAALDERLREVVALLDEPRGSRPAREEHDEPRQRPPPRARGDGSPLRHCARSRRERARRDGGVEPRALPELEHEQAPETVAVVGRRTRARASRLSTTSGRSCPRARARPSSSMSPASSRSGPRNQPPSGTPKPVLPRAASSGGTGLRTRGAGRPCRAGRPRAASRAARRRARAPGGRGAASGAPARPPSRPGRPSAAGRRAGRSRRRAAAARIPLAGGGRAARRPARRPERGQGRRCTALAQAPPGRPPSAAVALGGGAAATRETARRDTAASAGDAAPPGSARSARAPSRGARRGADPCGEPHRRVALVPGERLVAAVAASATVTCRRAPPRSEAWAGSPRRRAARRGSTPAGRRARPGRARPRAPRAPSRSARRRGAPSSRSS